MTVCHLILCDLFHCQGSPVLTFTSTPTGNDLQPDRSTTLSRAYTGTAFPRPSSTWSHCNLQMLAEDVPSFRVLTPPPSSSVFRLCHCVTLPSGVSMLFWSCNQRTCYVLDDDWILTSTPREENHASGQDCRHEREDCEWAARWRPSNSSSLSGW